MAARGRRKNSLDGEGADGMLKRKREQATAKPAKRVKQTQREDVAMLVEEQLRRETSRSLETSVDRDGAASQPAPGTDHNALTRRRKPKAEGLVDSPTLSPLQQKIEQQFSLEILLKHQELRLIEQELAKCQIALEQLRRCELIPYPASYSTTTNNEAVSSGTGPASTDAEWAPPWGVVNGPYSRHYARWLLPDKRFDGPSADDDLQHIRLDSSIAAKSRPHRGNAGKLHALSSGYPAPKERNGPLLVRRSTDNQLVKLVCLDCDRSDFSSAQGFINHCRIAHHRGFESHDAAAIACGQEVDADDLTVPEPETSSLVHPYIKKVFDDKENLPDIIPTKIKPSKPAEPFLGLVRSDRTPFLSDFLQQRRIDLNLKDMVEEAGETLEFSESEEEEEEAQPLEDDFYGARRMPFRSGVSPTAFRPSSKGSDSRAPTIQTDSINITPSEHELSPNTESTVESNNAPSLVSDDDEDEFEAHSETSSHTTAESEDEVTVVELEDGPESDLSPKRTALRSKSSKLESTTRMKLRKEDKHVTFVSPSPSASVRRSRRR